MISSIRKEMGKWKSLLWIAILSMVLGYAASFVLRTPSDRELKVLTVNHHPVYFNEFKSKLIEVQMRSEMIKNYARAQGLSSEMALAFSGMVNPQKTTLDSLIYSILIDEIGSNLNIQVSQSYFVETLMKSIPRSWLDQYGRINEKIYTASLKNMSLTVSEYEDKKEAEIKEELVKSLIENGSYVPSKIVIEDADKESDKKSFNILSFKFKNFLSQAKKEDIKDLEKFYNENKELYRIPEKRKANYWILSQKEYENNITIDDKEINIFYEKNKGTLFRIPPEIKVRRILIKADGKVESSKKADDIYDELIKAPEKFSELAKKYSGATNASSGGLVDFFKRGTYGADFEKISFRLKDKDEITKPFMTEDGIEIVQLVDRKPAKYKPTNVVKNEIIETLKTRKSINGLRSDLAKVSYQSKSDISAISRFVDNKKIKLNTSDWLQVKDGEGFSIESVLAKKVFERKDKNNYGHFQYKDDYVLFQEVDRINSKIPGLNSIKSDVEDDYYAKEAQDQIKIAIAKAKKDLWSKHAMSDIAEKYGADVIKTKKLNIDSDIDSINNSKSLVRKAFNLFDHYQLLKYKAGTDKSATDRSAKDSYIVQLENIEHGKSTIEDMTAFRNKILDSNRPSYLNMIIASLFRVAKIDKNENILNIS